MKRSSVMEARRQRVSPDARRQVDISFLIADRIHDILTAKGYKQKTLPTDMAKRAGNKQLDARHA